MNLIDSSRETSSTGNWKKTNWSQSSSHWKPGDGNEGHRLWKKSEERQVSETYAKETMNVVLVWRKEEK